MSSNIGPEAKVAYQKYLDAVSLEEKIKRLEEFGLEYRYIAQYLQKKIRYEEMIKKIQKESEHFAKRQMTWFRRWEKHGREIIWIKNKKEADKLVNNFIK